MPVIKCGGGVSTSLKTKKEALKWLEMVNKWPCSGPCPLSSQPCYRGGTFYRGYDLKTKDYMWFAQVFCVCGPPQVSESVGAPAVVAWTQVHPTRKRGSERGRGDAK
jgi:hypothetical protein